MSSTLSNFGGFILDSAYKGSLLVCKQYFQSLYLGSKTTRAYLAACSHYNIPQVVLLANYPSCEVSLPVIWYPYPFLLVELGLKGCCAGSLCTV